MLSRTSNENRIYAAIDLKSFFASVECRERGLDPLKTNLVVADSSRTEKTICLAVTPSLKEYKIPGRARLFEVVQKVRDVNKARLAAAKEGFTGKSYDAAELAVDPSLELDYIVAPPRMALYMEYSSRVYSIYLKYAAPEDIHVYSVDEVFIDLTTYLKARNMNAHEMVRTIISDILAETGITATAGIAPNLYLCKIAMDIVAKHIPADKDGVRIAELDVLTYRKLLWDHRPLTDFWRVGRGYAKKLEERGICTMGDIARCSLGGPNDYYNEDYLFKMFGVNAELLIDHAWGYEPCTIADIKAYKPGSRSLGYGQVLQCPYEYAQGQLIVKEMADTLALELVSKNLVTDQMVLTICYDVDNLKNGSYKGEVATDFYGRKVPKHAHGTQNIGRYTASARLIIEAALQIYNREVRKNLLIRKIYVTANNVLTENKAAEIESKSHEYEQLDFFTDYKSREEQNKHENAQLAKEKRMQQAALQIRRKFGKNSILKGMNLEEGANEINRNRQIGGHKA